MKTNPMGDTKPLVYIIIVTSNSRKQLEYCLPTVVTTDYPNYKVLVVDNNPKAISHKARDYRSEKTYSLSSSMDSVSLNYQKPTTDSSASRHLNLWGETF